MSFLANVKKGKQRRPRRTVISAVHGWGKSTLAAQLREAIFIDLEDGLGDLDVAKGPVCKSLGDVWAAVKELLEAEHDFATVVIDSIDWLERLVHRVVCQERGVKAISDIDFGKGYGRAFDIFCEVLDGIDRLRTERGLSIVFLAHTTTKKVEPPGKVSYTKHTLKLRDDVTDKVCEWCDEMLFGDYRVDVRTTDEGFNRERGLAMGKGERVLYTQEGPGHVAKNRLGLPRELDVPEPFTPQAAELVRLLSGL